MWDLQIAAEKQTTLHLKEIRIQTNKWYLIKDKTTTNNCKAKHGPKEMPLSQKRHFVSNTIAKYCFKGNPGFCIPHSVPLSVTLS